eukprot:CAMPEP_0118963560 /NCGR_PEP_ID=MMETSP1173-20130426/1401_1 /TAXON_ID=1034831 /ORGANISM="Rhizochromulina marina cf, Strain CCMP1243" /LENGTH=603 /DNA_ID=CAMNT_0006911899 /DNA_START=94 /DNA_END=1905 /DNA_ORIENTATION=+
MASLLHMMPNPARATQAFDATLEQQPAAPASVLKAIPPYLKRQGFVPRALEDFGDGGAFPEVHVSQYPLNMGRPKPQGAGQSSAIVAVDVGKDGEVKYDAIVKQGTNRDRTVYTSLDDMKAKDGDGGALQKPSIDEEIEAAEKTRQALEGIIGAKVAAARPNTVPQASQKKDAKFIQYTPNPNAPGVQGGAKQRIIKMVEQQVDPMEPPKHKHKKVPRGPPEDPVPILHSPQRKLTVKDQQMWKIPPCVSNWKNVGGYTIPLDKRLAADGRGLQEQTINNNFASLSEALYIAERKAREELEVRSRIQQKLSVKEKEQKESELREIAARARMARAGLSTEDVEERRVEDRAESRVSSAPSEPLPSDSAGARAEGGRRSNLPAWMTRGDAGDGDRRDDEERSRRRDEDEEEEEEEDRRHRGSREGQDEDRSALEQREKARIDRRKEREREMRLDNMKGNMKKSKYERERERDVSEKIALGLHTGAQRLEGEAQFDSRLFNQSAGMSQGFGQEDDYNVYSKPLFDRGAATSVYRPKRDDSEMYGDADEQYKKLADTSRFKPDKGFRGADTAEAQQRDGPVQFQREGDSKDPSDRAAKRRRRDDEDE